jgi:hypothetical protein
MNSINTRDLHRPIRFPRIITCLPLKCRNEGVEHDGRQHENDVWHTNMTAHADDRRPKDDAHQPELMDRTQIPKDMIAV